MPKILHCGDLHLDTPFHSKKPEQSAVMRNELNKAFSSMIAYVKENKIPLVLMAGDVFDSPSVTGQTLSFVKESFASAPETSFVISPGNHDPYTADGVYGGELPRNVFVFKTSELSYFDFPNINVRVYGYAFVSPSLESCPFIGAEAEDKGMINLLLAHGEVGNPLSLYCPISEKDIEGTGFDYCALGHIHLDGEIKYAGKVPYAYSGCLMGRDFGETGDKGAFEITLEKGPEKCVFEAQKVQFSPYNYRISALDLSAVTDSSALREAIRNETDKYNETTLLRIELTGYVPLELRIDTASLESELGEKLFCLELEDNTVPLYGAEQLKKDPTILGAFFNELLPMLENGTAEERRLASKALRAGISALRGEDID